MCNPCAEHLPDPRRSGLRRLEGSGVLPEHEPKVRGQLGRCGIHPPPPRRPQKRCRCVLLLSLVLLGVVAVVPRHPAHSSQNVQQKELLIPLFLVPFSRFCPSLLEKQATRGQRGSSVFFCETTDNNNNPLATR